MSKKSIKTRYLSHYIREQQEGFKLRIVNLIIDKTQKVNQGNGNKMCPKFKKCPKCGGITLVYDPVKQVAYCRSSICSFKEEVEDKVSYNTKFG